MSKFFAQQTFNDCVLYPGLETWIITLPDTRGFITIEGRTMHVLMTVTKYICRLHE